jgi:hypothetical protein
VDVLRYIPVEMVGIALVVGAAAGLPGAAALLRGDLRVAVRQFAVSGLIGWALVVMALTLLGGGIGREVDLAPGAGIREQLSNINRSLGLINLIGNVLMFVPGGFLLVTALRWTPARAIAVLVAASVAIEVFQYAEGRAADIDDLILNATGAVVGAAIGWFSVRVWRARQQRMGLLSPG